MQSAESRQRTKLISRIKFFPMFGNYDGGRFQPTHSGELMQCVAIDLLQPVRRIQKHEVRTGFANAQAAECLGRLALNNLDPRRNFERAQIFVNDLDRGGGRFYEIHLSRAAAQRFDSNTSRACEEIEPNRISQRIRIASSQHIEECFAQTVGRWTYVQAPQRTERTAAILACDNPQGDPLVTQENPASLRSE